MNVETACSCGCGALTRITRAQEPCACGCACCTEGPGSSEDEIAELLALNDAIVRRLGELGVK